MEIEVGRVVLVVTDVGKVYKNIFIEKKEHKQFKLFKYKSKYWTDTYEKVANTNRKDIKSNYESDATAFNNSFIAHSGHKHIHN